MPWLEKTRRLAIVKMRRDEQELKNFPQLRSVLFVRGSFEDKSSFLHRDVKLLRVLDLQGVRFRVIPNTVFNQYHLRYLSLRDTKVEMIPNSIGGLRNLEVLDLRGTDITNLPSTIWKLELLRHLMCGHSRFPQSSQHSTGFEAIPGIGFLQYLQTLYYVELNGNEAILEELGRLKQLRKLGVRNLGKEQGLIFCSSLGNLGKLRNLSVESISPNEILDLQYLFSPPKFLERLHLSGRLVVLPPWISSLQNLIKLSLSATQLQEDQFVYLQSLPSLLSLSLHHEAYVGETLCFKAASLEKLRFLSLYMLTNLKQVIVEEGAISSLEEMEFIACQCLKEVPSGIEQLTNLKSLILQHPSQDLINSIDCTKGGEAYHKVKNIPSIRIFIYPNTWYNLPRERD
ncbi:Leucine-rich repeat, typical subtype [Corchorus capsularis]|uniref:Leucine-rich repeat, typical subtype n=1 Tax=Corchorus capsularis TaxID=210143 RepID=A0A1R3G467_COCAP|nr:Leucine-rich repeat, typical subtype [Corchorus capsularis]